MRKQLLSVVLPLLILGLIAAAAETQNTGTDATTHAALQRVNVVHGEDGISLEITARGAVTPKLSTLSSPARVVIDLPNTVALTDQRHVEVDSDGVKDVRVGMNGQTPPSTRVVVDLDKACKFELVAGNDNKIVVRLHTASATAKAAKPSETVVASAPKAADHRIGRR
jgi:AMIN domain